MCSMFKLFVQAVSIILILSVTLTSSDVFAQNGLRIYEVPGGGGSTNTQQEESNDDTFFYIAGGLIVAGILVYALVIKKDKKADEDSTKSKSDLNLIEINNVTSTDAEIQKVRDNIPVDLFMGIRNNEAVLNDKTYLLGLKVKF